MSEKKNKKINKMTLSELDKAIEATKSSMGGLTSAYAKELLKRKENLSAKK
jgi:hypothetical protein